MKAMQRAMQCEGNAVLRQCSVKAEGGSVRVGHGLSHGAVQEALQRVNPARPFLRLDLRKGPVCARERACECECECVCVCQGEQSEHLLDPLLLVWCKFKVCLRDSVCVCVCVFARGCEREAHG